MSSRRLYQADDQQREARASRANCLGHALFLLKYLFDEWSGAASLFGLLEKFGEIFLPGRGLKKCVMAACLVADGQQNKFSVLYFLDCALGDAELAWIPEIVLHIDEHEVRTDLGEIV